jgi:hypothetical protein
MFSTLCFVLSAMDGKIKQHVCIKFCLKLGKSVTETLEMILEAGGEHSLRWTAVSEWHSCLKAVVCQLKMTNVHCDLAQTKQQKMLKKFKNSSTKTVTEQSMSSQTLLESVMEFARRS